MAELLFFGPTDACEEFLDLIVRAGETAAKAARNIIADMDALDRWADDGGPCVESV